MKSDETGLKKTPDGTAMSDGPSGWQHVPARVVQGHRVASGQGRDPRYPEGTLALQIPLFRQRGLDLSPYFPGTINASIAPYRYEVRRPRYTFRQVAWSEHVPPEDFSFFDCRIHHGSTTVDGLVYYPHPETKPEHEQPPDVLELLAPRLDGLGPGAPLTLALDPEQLRIWR